MRAQRDAVHPISRRASPARHNPPELDSCEPTSRNASPGDITKTTPPGGDSRTARRVPGRTRLPRGGARGGRRDRHDRGRSGPNPSRPRRRPVRRRRPGSRRRRACGVRVRSGWTLDEENRNRSRAPHALPLCPADAFESTISAAGPVDGPGLGRGRGPRWSGCPGRRRPRAHAPGDFGSGRGSINLRARRRGRRLRAGRIRRRARR